MKRILLASIISFIVISGSALAHCGGSISSSCGDPSSCPDRICSTCECADPNLGANNCLSNRDYCDAFGNIGSR